MRERQVFLLNSSATIVLSVLDLLHLQLDFVCCISSAEMDRCVVFADGRSKYAECHTVCVCVCGWMDGWAEG